MPRASHRTTPSLVAPRQAPRSSLAPRPTWEPFARLFDIPRSWGYAISFIDPTWVTNHNVSLLNTGYRHTCYYGASAHALEMVAREFDCTTLSSVSARAPTHSPHARILTSKAASAPRDAHSSCHTHAHCTSSFLRLSDSLVAISKPYDLFYVPRELARRYGLPVIDMASLDWTEPQGPILQSSARRPPSRATLRCARARRRT